MVAAARELHLRGDRRAVPRVAIDRAGTARFADGTAIDLTIADLTRNGCRIVTEADIAPGATFQIGIANVGLVHACAVWRSAAGYGCEFDAELPAGAVTAASRASNIALFPGVGPEPCIAAHKVSPRMRAAVLASAMLASWSALYAVAHFVA